MEKHCKKPHTLDPVINPRAKLFDRAYERESMYYGWEVRHEFERFFGNTDLSGKTALDLGAGEGRYSVYIAKRGCEVVAVDFSRAGIKKLEGTAKGMGLKIRPVLCDIARFDFKESEYDLVIASTILDHLEAHVRAKTIEGIKSCLKPSALLYANVFTTDDPGCLKNQGRQGSEGISDTASSILHYFEKGELKKAFADMEILYYYEGVEEDLSHGTPHSHGWASLVAKKGQP